MLERSSQYMHCLIRCRDGSFEGLVTVVYAYNTREHRRALWESLVALSQSITQPWTVLGDLNVVLSQEEKVVEEGSALAVSTELSDFLCEAALEDMKYYGQKFTWSNHHTWCKLDRVLVNGSWLEKYKDSFARFDGFGILDHSPMSVTVKSVCEKLRLPFRFKNVWVQDAGYEELVKEVWGQHFYGR